jgi:enediyne polyketide synthase
VTGQLEAAGLEATGHGAPASAAALALEAMAQAAARLSSADGVPVFENVDLRTDQVRATPRYTGVWPSAAGRWRPISPAPRVPLDPATDLYGEILSPGQPRQRILGYRTLSARSCVAEISTEGGDPGIRQAFLDAIAGCVPDARLRPVSVDRFYPAGALGPGGPLVLYAAERHRRGRTHTYDLDVHAAASGRLIERWQGLCLVAEPRNGGAGPWVPALLGPYLERRLAGGRPRCIVEPDAGGPDSRRGQLTAAVRRMLGRPVLIWYRDDGRPEVAEDGIFIAAAHSAGVMLAVASTKPAGCDARAVQERPRQDWRTLLGADHFEVAELIRRDRGEPLSVAATRVWAAAECLRQAGRAGQAGRTGQAGRAGQAGRDHRAPVIVARSHPDGWVRLGSGPAQITTFPARVRDVAHPVVFTILTEGRGHAAVLRIPPRRRVRRGQPRRERVPRQLHALGGPVPGNVPARARVECA